MSTKGEFSRTITSNNTKLLKHLSKLKDIQEGKPVGPVMVHLALTNNCNLDCDYCCYGGRAKGDELSLEQACSVIDQFSSLGTKGLEITGGGDPLLHPNVNQIVAYGKSKGMSIGLITNGVAYNRFSEWDKLDWIRISSHVLNNKNKILNEKFDKAIQTAKSYPNLNVGSVHIYTGNDANLKHVRNYMDIMEIPTRITPDLTKSPEWIKDNMVVAAEIVKDSKYCFVSDFNIKFERSSNNCYMKLIKPYVHPDGVVYQCPGASFSPENFCNVDAKYKVCNIEDIVKTYNSIDNLKSKDFDCRFCKYQTQNDLISEILVNTKDNDFA